MSENPTLAALGLKPLADIRKDAEEAEEVFSDQPIQGVAIYEGSDQLPAVPEPDRELLDDLDAAKSNINSIIEQGTDGLTDILSIAKQTESPQAFLAATAMMKALLEANREKVNMSEKKKFEKNEQPAAHAVTNVTNNNLVLSTTDLLAMLKGDKK